MKYHWQYETVRQCGKCWRVGRFKRPDLFSVFAQTRRVAERDGTYHKCAICPERCQSKQTHCWRCKRAGLASSSQPIDHSSEPCPTPNAAASTHHAQPSPLPTPPH